MDSDEDGYGNDLLVQYNCSEVEGYVTANGDCDDGDVGINPGIVEVCDGADNNCDGGVDEGFPLRLGMQMPMRMDMETIWLFSTVAQR